jgi:hypothetical protein
MLESGYAITTLSGETLKRSMVKDCLQKGVLSPLLQSLIVYKLS